MGLNELARALSQSIVAEPLAGLAGIYGTVTGGVGEGVRLIDKVREKVGYQPETKEGIRNLDALARALAPVNNALEKARTTLGDGTFNATGSPALAAAAYTAPDAILSALGARPAMAAGRSAQAGIGRAVRRASELPSPTMGSPASQIGAITYHGTPHRFAPVPGNELGAFDLSKVGTGEGAQAYGHGVYLTDSPEVGMKYQPRSEQLDAFHMGKYSAAEKAQRFDEMELWEAAMLHRTPTDIAKSSDFEHLPQQLRESVAQQMRVAISETPSAGSFYTVDLPDDAIARMLDWDKPLSEQPQAVREAWDSWLNSPEGKALRDSGSLNTSSRFGGELRGQDVFGNIYEGYANPSGGEQPMVSRWLQGRGIPGIRYLDGNSRGAGQGTYNYVVFDDKLPRIVGRE